MSYCPYCDSNDCLHARLEDAESTIAHLRAENAPLRAALAELVRLKDLHDACQDQTYWATRAVSAAQLDAWEADYEVNKPKAWAAARETLKKMESENDAIRP